MILIKLAFVCISVVIVRCKTPEGSTENYKVDEQMKTEPSDYTYSKEAPYDTPVYTPKYESPGYSKPGYDYTTEKYRASYKPEYNYKDKYNKPESSYGPSVYKPKYESSYSKPGYGHTTEKYGSSYKPEYKQKGKHDHKPDNHKYDHKEDYVYKSKSDSGYNSKPGYKPHSEHKPSYKASYGGSSAYNKPSYCDPTYAPACAKDKGAIFCFDDYEYPKYEIEAAIEKDYEFINKYSDVASQSADDLVDTIDSYQETKFNYDFFHPDTFDKSHWSGPEGYICPSSVGYVQPFRARNAVGQWRVIVQDVKYYTQTIRTEACRDPDTDCRLVAPCFKSSCTQKHIYERLLSWDPCNPDQGLFVDVFKVPSACSCHVPEY
ncbi:uncharacterized protein LOC136031671 [Artemia franciscana]